MTNPDDILATRDRLSTAIAALRAAGVPAGEIAERAGLTPRRVRQLLGAPPTVTERQLARLAEVVEEIDAARRRE